MMRASWTMAAVLAVLAALAVGTPATDLEVKVAETVEEFRSIMPTGCADINIPVMEPVCIKELPLSIKFSPFDAKVIASNIKVVGASGFELPEIKQVDGTTNLNMVLELPSVEVTGNYDMQGKVKIGFIKFNLNSIGDLLMAIEGIKGNGVADILTNPDGSLHINDITVNDWSYDKLDISLSNLFNGGVMGKTVNKLINKIAPSFLKSNRAKINKLVGTVGKKFLNQYLDGVAGKTSVRMLEDSMVEAENWDVSAEVQEMLDQLALMVVAAPAEDADADADAETDATPLEAQAAKLLDDFRGMMLTGQSNYDIPILDPAAVAKLPIDVQHTLFNAKIVASESEIAGVSTFKVNSIKQIEGTNKLTLEIELSEVDIIGKFDMKGKIKLGFISHTLNDQGPYGLDVEGIKLVATTEVVSNADGSVNLGDVTVDSWTIGGIKIQLDGLLGGGVLGKEANKLFNKALPTIVESDRDRINAWIETATKGVFNKYLNGLAGKVSADLEALIWDLSEAFRVAMKAGREDLGIAVMDPTSVSELSVQVHKWLIDGQVTTSNTVVSGSSDFKLTEVAQIVGTDKFTIKFEVPTLNIASTYDLASQVNVLVTKLNVNRQGELKVTANRLKGVATVELFVDIDDQLTLKALEVDSWDYDSLVVDVDDLADGGFMKETVSKLINKVVPSLLVQPHLDDLKVWVATAGDRVIGRFLDGVAGRVVLPHLDTRAAELLEDLKEVMKTGSADVGMPILDPFVLEKVSFSFNSKLVDANVENSNILVSGTSVYDTKISQIKGSNDVTVEIYVPAIDATGKFNVDGELNLWIKKAAWSDAGTVTAAVRDLKVIAEASLTDNIDGFLVLKDLKIKSWTYDKDLFKMNFLTSADPGRRRQIFNAAISEVLPSVIKLANDEITAWAERTSKMVLDQYLAGVAAKATAPVAVHINTIPAEAKANIERLALLAVNSGVAKAA